MAITITATAVGRNRIRYRLTSTTAGTDTGSITTTGAAKPDLQTDLLTIGVGNQGPLLAIAKAPTAGYGQIAAGALTQAQARGLYLSERTGTNANPGTALATALCRLTPQVGLGGSNVGSWLVDVNVSGGNPTINVTSIGVSPTGVEAACFLDVFLPDQIGA